MDIHVDRFLKEPIQVSNLTITRKDILDRLGISYKDNRSPFLILQDAKNLLIDPSGHDLYYEAFKDIINENSTTSEIVFCISWLFYYFDDKENEIRYLSYLKHKRKAHKTYYLEQFMYNVFHVYREFQEEDIKLDYLMIFHKLDKKPVTYKYWLFETGIYDIENRSFLDKYEQEGILLAYDVTYLCLFSYINNESKFDFVDKFFRNRFFENDEKSYLKFMTAFGAAISGNFPKNTIVNIIGTSKNLYDFSESIDLYNDGDVLTEEPSFTFEICSFREELLWSNEKTRRACLLICLVYTHIDKLKSEMNYILTFPGTLFALSEKPISNENDTYKTIEIYLTGNKEDKLFYHAYDVIHYAIQKCYPTYLQHGIIY